MREGHLQVLICSRLEFCLQRLETNWSRFAAKDPETMSCECMFNLIMVVQPGKTLRVVISMNCLNFHLMLEGLDL